MNKRYRYRQKLKENLRKRFRAEYLGQLKHYAWKRCPISLQIGQIILVGNDQTKRLSWPLAKVLELYPGKDGNIRVARLKTAHAEFLRTLQRLYPMEMTPDSSDGVQQVSESSQPRSRLVRTIKVPSRFQDFELK
ncbi:hypothetical protein JTE90_015789 [Oedothorax gibbosus]|uniref:DUF5641 domain-containing protein n=1 Tax=Oedothorax gibbosus TaxID=931172 RepID=A0AAV6U0P6_9ARAC|nr:hypothetical protein JTE90_015789 [Oedothorax gibbosus]